MKYITFLFLILVMLSTSLLSACQSKNKNPQKEVAQFVSRIEDASKKAELTRSKIVENKVSVAYDGANSRDPFELPETIKNIKNYQNSILKDMSIDGLKLTGIMIHDNNRWAIFRANDGKVYKLTEGMRVGMQQALLTQISPNQVKFIVDEAGGDEGKREIIMTIQD